MSIMRDVCLVVLVANFFFLVMLLTAFETYLTTWGVWQGHERFYLLVVAVFLWAVIAAYYFGKLSTSFPCKGQGSARAHSN